VKPKRLTPHLGLALPLCGCQDQHADKFRLYVLDGHMDKLFRIAAPATFAGTPQIARCKPLPNPAAGEQAGDTSLFEAQADWLKTATNFAAAVKLVAPKGKPFKDVKSKLPKGNESLRAFHPFSDHRRKSEEHEINPE
jgi:hypothetical protein